MDKISNRTKDSNINGVSNTKDSSNTAKVYFTKIDSYRETAKINTAARELVEKIQTEEELLIA
ncbi:MAG: hypothetical protein NTY48_05495 [Candidatus Diapherotrites archaeon]|nr:hypothetical protein [Candidatus Diapherotrites archaeon]